MTTLRVLLLHNPAAGGDEHSAELLVDLVEAAGHDVSWQSTEEDGWRDVLASPTDLVVVAGGDGTVLRVLPLLARRHLRATLLPVGTANNIARSLGFRDDDPARLITGWPEASIRRFDIATLTGAGERLDVVEGMGGGAFAEALIRADTVEEYRHVDDKVERGRRALLDVLSEPQPLDWHVELDGVESTEELIAFEVLNIREAGPNLPLAPDADPGDGLLDAVFVRAADADALADYVRASLAGNEPEAPRFEVRRAREIAARPPADAALHLDDEIIGRLGDRPAGDRLVVRTATALEVLVPSGSEPASS